MSDEPRNLATQAEMHEVEDIVLAHMGACTRQAADHHARASLTTCPACHFLMSSAYRLIDARRRWQSFWLAEWNGQPPRRTDSVDW